MHFSEFAAELEKTPEMEESFLSKNAVCAVLDERDAFLIYF